MKYPVPPPTCKVCDKPIVYQSRRRKCELCDTWAHLACSLKARAGKNAGKRGCVCCHYEKPDMDFLRHEVIHLFELKGPDDPDLVGYLILMTSIHWTGPDEEKVCEVTGLPPEEVAWRAENLRKQGIWEDGKVCIYGGDTPEESMIGLTIAALVAEGMVARA